MLDAQAHARKYVNSYRTDLPNYVNWMGKNGGKRVKWIFSGKVFNTTNNNNGVE